jgi:DivIVA domain-containing protein
MSITTQDILEQEFHVRFRGFDKDEVDAFLEKVAESYFNLLEENKQLNEQVKALQKGRGAPGTIDKSLLDAIASVKEIANEAKSMGQREAPAELTESINELNKSTASISEELAALKEGREIYGALEKSIKEAAVSAREAVSEMQSIGQQETPATLPKALDELKQNTEDIGAELTTIKEELASFQQLRKQLKSELHDLLQSQLGEFEKRFLKERSIAAPVSAEPEKTPAKKAGKKTPQPEKKAADTRVSDTDLEGSTDDEPDMEALPDNGKYDEEDILDEDKLRDLFASIMDDDISAEEASTDDDSGLLAGVDMTEDDHEPEVTFILDDALIEEPDNEPDKKADN